MCDGTHICFFHMIMTSPTKSHQPKKQKQKQHALLRAGVKMQQDGWWWKGTEEQPLTASTIQSQMSKEIVGALFGMRK
jgi:hypothetical protein